MSTAPIATTKTPTHSQLLDEAVKALEAAEKVVQDPNQKALVTNAKSAVQNAAQTQIVLSLSVIPPTRIDRQKVVDRRQVGFALLLCILAACMFANDILVKHGYIWLHYSKRPWVALILVGLVDFFLILLLRAVAFRGSDANEKFPYIPTRAAAVLELGFFYFALVLSFAHLDFVWHLTKTLRESLYRALLTVATLDHEFEVGNGIVERAIVSVELLSVIVLFFVFFPLLISRLAMFKGETVTTDDLLRASDKPLESYEQSAFELRTDFPTNWTINKIPGVVHPGSQSIKLRIKESGKATVE
jgi:hypothetical protein